jgi:hypothetical protein
LVLVLVFALPAAAQDRLPAAEQHATAPSAPGQSNREVLVHPSGTLRQASSGLVLQGQPGQRVVRVTILPGTGSCGSSAGDVEGLAVPPSAPSVSEPGGPPLVEAAYLTLRGTLAAVDKRLVTIVDRNGRSRTVPLAPRARVDDGLKAGDLVAVRIPLEDDPANKAASRVERQGAAAKAPMSSKFSQAQAAAH